MHCFQVKIVLVVAFLVCSYLEIASGSCLSYGHSCWGAHGKRSGGGQLKKQHSGERIGLAERWALVKLNYDAFPRKGTQQLLTPDQRNNDPNVAHQSIDVKPFPSASDEEETNVLIPTFGGRDQRLKNNGAYGNVDFEEDSIDDISMAASMDDIPAENRNPRFFRFLNPNLSKMVS